MAGRDSKRQRASLKVERLLHGSLKAIKLSRRFHAGMKC
jgi:hypothetical protein